MNAVESRGAEILERNPAPVLRAGTDLPSDAELKRRQHLRESTAIGTQHDANPQMHDSNSLSCRWICRSLPLPAHIRKEARAGSAVFAKQFGSTIAVISNRRRADQNLGRFF